LVTVNVVVLAGTVSADPVQRRMPSGDEVNGACDRFAPGLWPRIGPATYHERSRNNRE
jgi:hypothetical protein